MKDLQNKNKEHVHRASPLLVGNKNKLTANIIGATGLVGQQLILQLLKNEHFEKIRIFVRRDAEISHPKLEQHIVDLGDEKSWEKLLKGDVLFSTLGTTLKQTGSKEKQYEIDYTLNLKFATKAKENEIEHYVLVSSIGANPKSKIFYTRMKGELDNAVAQIGFEKLTILRPASLTGERSKKRMIETVSIPIIVFLTKFMLKKYRPISAALVAQAMIKAALSPHRERIIWEGEAVFELADEK
ncbi:NAD(P)H-binding protein [Prolixibacteraceae bacterium Z1-6]|uniref:NAD(P)H-binding protein n=1 Tax=Draconibacterium aestuarii TaxID=2998507 RepID=A0A9X3F6A6_9BACT|nr:NAD(P)H-binding protein [Prolixibacteraceae bacterium Z1-6]